MDQVDQADLALAFYFDELHRGASVPSALNSAVGRFPRYAELIADAACSASIPFETVEATHSELALVSAARKRFTENHAPKPLASLLGAARLLQLNNEAILNRLKIGLSVWVKLERRSIDVATIPAAFLDELSDLLFESAEAVFNYLAQPAGVPIDGVSKSKRGVTASSETFSQALMSSMNVGGNAEHADDYWLRFILESGSRKEL